MWENTARGRSSSFSIEDVIYDNPEYAIAK